MQTTATVDALRVLKLLVGLAHAAAQKREAQSETSASPSLYVVEKG